MSEDKREKKYKKLRTAADLERLMTRHYTISKFVGRLKPVAWVTSGAPVEILRAMDIFPVYPENYGALCGARLAAVPLAQVAEAQGYSPDLCSYARSNLGSVFEAKKAPLGGLPRPHLLICCNNICSTVVKWYEALAAHYRIPLFVLDTPFLHDRLTDHIVRYVLAQFHEMVAFLERTTHRTLHSRKLSETVALANRATVLWGEIRALCKIRPSPLNAPDLFVNMAPIVVLRGTKEAVGFYEKLKAEVEERVERGISALPEERYRLLWDNIAIWHRLFRFYRYFVDYGACFVVDTYTGAWSTQIEWNESLESLARAYTTVFLNQSLEYRTELALRSMTEFEVDGFVMHCNRSCKPYSLGQYAMKAELTARTGLPGLIVESDMCDHRAHADEPIRTRIQTFMETLTTRTGRG